LDPGRSEVSSLDLVEPCAAAGTVALVDRHAPEITELAQ